MAREGWTKQQWQTYAQALEVLVHRYATHTEGCAARGNTAALCNCQFLTHIRALRDLEIGKVRRPDAAAPLGAENTGGALAGN